MKKSTYDVVSTVSILTLVVSTFLAQRISHAGYVFGIIAVLSAVGLFAAYVKALPGTGSTNGERTQAADVIDDSPHQLRSQAQLLVDTWLSERKSRTKLQMEDDAGIRYEIARYKPALLHYAQIHSRQLQLFDDAVNSGKSQDINALHGFRFTTQVKYHHEQVYEPATVITEIVKRLCTSSDEPRFEFVLASDGSFTIRQMADLKQTSIGSFANRGRSRDSGSQRPN
jgi:hypothetical protein